ncbi:hypothetical protein HJC23_011434 [Cyclotella cryptica]|uniref:Transmembrane protein n=1 Tax=Cyclotella cryptica TaxID=29204 RepID=A0ABD3P164_9STRA|eukprot:CCRYP_018205-RA/>CCRYP_018205-RA protein AED:0.10 eAED:0.10 QI:0/-1/0/1/-1/1/1/0/541
MKGQSDSTTHTNGPEINHWSWWGGNSNKRKSNDCQNKKMLSVPDFVSDAFKSVENSTNNCDDDMLEKVNAAIDDRINELSGLFRSRHLEYAKKNRRDERSIREMKRATEYTDQQLIDLVLGNTGCTETHLSPPLDGDADNSILRHHSDTMTEIRAAYQHRREELRDMAKSYLESHRNNGRFPFWPPDPLDGAAMNGQPRNRDGNHAASRDVHIDEHGRLVRRNLLQDGVGQQRDRDPNNDRSEQVGENSDLVDASETFWKFHYLAKTQRDRNFDTTSSREERNSSHSFSSGLDTSNHTGHHPPLPPPVHQQHELHQLSLQMERDAQNAIERALERYRRQSNINSSSTEDVRVFELIPIPLVRQENQGNNEQQRWFNRFLQRNQANGAANNPAGDIDNGRHLARMGPNNAPLQRQHGWIDLRLAFRRICFAVLTVVAAFICTMLQGVPMDFGDDVVYVNGVEVDRTLFTGLLGPHFTGYHHVGRPTAASQQYDYRVLKEGEVEEMSNLDHFLKEIFEDEEEQQEKNLMEYVKDRDISCNGSS